MGNSCSPGCQGEVFDGVFLCWPFSHKMSWMTSWTELSQILRVFLPSVSSMYYWLPKRHKNHIKQDVLQSQAHALL